MKLHPQPITDAAAIQALGGPRVARRLLTAVADALVEGVLGDAEAAGCARDLVDVLISRASRAHREGVTALAGVEGVELLRRDRQLEATRDHIRQLDALRRLIDERSGT